MQSVQNNSNSQFHSVKEKSKDKNSITTEKLQIAPLQNLFYV